MSAGKPVLIACECSQVECTAFRMAGYEAYSCDVQKCLGNHPEWHLQCDVRDVMCLGKWGLIVAHPPCTYLCAMGAVHMRKKGKLNEERLKKMILARDFFMMFYNWNDCPVAIENPRPLSLAVLPGYTQIICPTQYGHEYTKRTYLWLKDLPELLPVTAKGVNMPSWVYHTHAGNKRSRSFEGIAEAMAMQWGKFIL